MSKEQIKTTTERTTTSLPSSLAICKLSIWPFLFLLVILFFAAAAALAVIVVESQNQQSGGIHQDLCFDPQRQVLVPMTGTSCPRGLLVTVKLSVHLNCVPPPMTPAQLSAKLNAPHTLDPNPTRSVTTLTWSLRGLAPDPTTTPIPSPAANPVPEPASPPAPSPDEFAACRRAVQHWCETARLDRPDFEPYLHQHAANLAASASTSPSPNAQADISTINQRHWANSTQALTHMPITLTILAATATLALAAIACTQAKSTFTARPG